MLNLHSSFDYNIINHCIIGNKVLSYVLSSHSINYIQLLNLFILLFILFTQIQVHADLPVGSFIQDHVIFPIRGSINESLTLTYPRSTSVLAKLRYNLFGGGKIYF